MSAKVHLRWLGGRSRCGRGTQRIYNHERVTCRRCLKLGPQQLEFFPRTLSETSRPAIEEAQQE